MTVIELIRKLSEYPNDMRVVTAGFDECGIDDIAEVVPMKVLFHDDIPSGGHCGRHDEDKYGVDAVYIDHQ